MEFLDRASRACPSPSFPSPNRDADRGLPHGAIDGREKVIRVASDPPPEVCYPRESYMPSLETAARSLKIVPTAALVHGDVEIETAITALGREPEAALSSCRMDSRFCIARRSYRRRSETTYRRSIRNLSSPETAACSPMESTK
jgi:hypothetical protein